jgi:hypothetical protein
MTARQFEESTADTEPVATSRPASSGNSSAGSLLALQSSAGNGAVARMMTVQRDPIAGAPAQDSLAQANVMEDKLQAERKKLTEDYQATTAQWQKLQDQEAAGPLDDESKAAMAEVKKSQDALHSAIGQNEKDLKLIKEPGASDQALNEMMARRGQSATAAPTSQSSATGW